MKSQFGISFRNSIKSAKIGLQNEYHIEKFKSTFGEVFFLCNDMGSQIDCESKFNLAASKIKKHIILNPNELSNPDQIIEEAIKSANIIRTHESLENIELSRFDMESLLFIFKEGIVNYVITGNSIEYLIRDKRILPLKHNSLNRDDIQNKDFLIYQDKGSLETFKYDKLLFCDYRFSNILDDKKIFNIVSDLQPQEACDALVDIARLAGITNKIFVFVIQMLDGKPFQDDLSNKSLSSNFVSKQKMSEDSTISESIEKEKSIKFHKNDISYSKKRKKLIPVLFNVSYIIIIILIFAITDLNFLQSSNNITKSTLLQEMKSNDKNITVENNINNSNLEVRLTMLFKNLYQGENLSHKFNLRNVDSNIIFENFINKDINDNVYHDYNINKLIDDIRNNDMKFIDMKKFKKEDDMYFTTELILLRDGSEVTYTVVIAKNKEKYKISEITYKDIQVDYKLTTRKKRSKVTYSYNLSRSLLQEKYSSENGKHSENIKKDEDTHNIGKRVILDDKILK